MWDFPNFEAARRRHVEGAADSRLLLEGELARLERRSKLVADLLVLRLLKADLTESERTTTALAVLSFLSGLPVERITTERLREAAHQFDTDGGSARRAEELALATISLAFLMNFECDLELLESIGEISAAARHAARTTIFIVTRAIRDHTVH